MRRQILVLVLGLLLIPALASAQILGIGNALNISSTSAQVSNSTANTALFSGTIPAGFLSSGRVHLKILGVLSTVGSSPGTFTVQAIYGPTTTTIVNAATLTSALANAPASIDVWLSPINSVTQQHVWGVWQHQSTSTAFVQIAGQGIGLADTTAALGLTVNFQFGTASAGNGFTMQSAIMTAGN